MSDHSTDARQPAGRVIVELAVDGTMWLERYTNGSRTRTKLDRGDEWWQVVDELHVQRDASIGLAERNAARLEEKSRKRHRSVWIHAAEADGQGVDFAKKTIGGEVPIGYGKYFAQPTAKTKVKKETNGLDMANLL